MSKELISSNGDFGTVISIIENAQDKALKAVNTELIRMYWDVGEYLSSLYWSPIIPCACRTRKF